MRLALSLMILLVTAATASAQRAKVVYAGGQWVALDRGSACEAASRSLRVAAKSEPQARAGFAFDAATNRRGQFFARLSRVPRPGSSVMLTVGDQPFMLVSRGDWAWSRGPDQEAAILAAVRTAPGLRLDARDAGGRRIIDRYLLAGAATAIDSAAACALAKSPRST